METSALTGQNVDKLFENIVKHLYVINKSKLEAYVIVFFNMIPLLTHPGLHCMILMLHLWFCYYVVCVKAATEQKLLPCRVFLPLIP